MNIEAKYETIINGLDLDKKHSIYLLLSVLDSMSVGILIINLRSKVIYVNQRYSEITGVKYNQIVGQKLRDIRPGARLPEVLETRQYINNVPRKEGEKEYFVDLTPICLNDELIGALSIMKDIKEAKTISKELTFFKHEITKIKSVLSDAYRAKFTFDDIIGVSKIMTKTKDLAIKAAQSDGGILLTGNTGTGKEVFAQAIHNKSKRKDGPFVPINCATIPTNFIESELFGYEDGAFTGAKKGGKLGLIEVANSGTLFLDEIENMDLNLQSKLLRVLQERKIRHLGGVQEIEVDIRLISATNVDIEKMIEEGKFRQDLFYRLCIFPIYLPDLKDRQEDIKLLVDSFINRMRNKYRHHIEVEPLVYDILRNYSWKGNVRELQNAIEYSVDVSNDFVITPYDLPQRIKKGSFYALDESNRSLKDILEEIEKKIIKQYISKYGNSVSSKKIIAKKLGISIATLYNKL